MSGAMKTEKAAEQDSRAYEVVEEIFLLGTALQARYRPLGAGVQEDDEVSGCCGDLPQVHPEPRHVSEERRDASKLGKCQQPFAAEYRWHISKNIRTTWLPRVTTIRYLRHVPPRGVQIHLQMPCRS